jgi:SAM-dependent methyltransferase
MEDERIRRAVCEGYAKIARNQSSCCGSGSSCCRGGETAQEIGKNIGYTNEEMKMVPEGSNLGLGCGNPLALTSLKEGEVVLDLGSGAGFDCFLAANKVGASGKIIGVDMTPEMIEKSRENARKGGYTNTEFRLGEIENLPVADDSVDIIISNCVINLAPDKRRVFAEAFRVLKPGGRLMVSDIVLSKELPDFVKNSVSAYVGCLAGALLKLDYLSAVKSAGFRDVRVVEERAFPIDFMLNDPTAQALVEDSKELREMATGEIAKTVASVKISAVKPANA